VPRVTAQRLDLALTFQAVRSRLDMPRLHRRVGILLALAALGGQLAAVADALFVAHVTCLAHGDRIHVSDGPPLPVTDRWSGVRGAAVDSEGDAHAQCLLDDDVDVVPAPSPATLPVPYRSAALSPLAESAPLPGPRLPLYRLAPKNSPPA
jgi:hypothetical protein